MMLQWMRQMILKLPNEGEAEMQAFHL